MNLNSQPKEGKVATRLREKQLPKPVIHKLDFKPSPYAKVQNQRAEVHIPENISIGVRLRKFVDDVMITEVRFGNTSLQIAKAKTEAQQFANCSGVHRFDQ